MDQEDINYLLDKNPSPESEIQYRSREIGMNDRWADMEKALDEWSHKYKQLEAEITRYKTALEQIRDLESNCCQHCEGDGNRYADSKSHYMSENAPTIPCGWCGGSGQVLPEEDTKSIAIKALEGK